MNLKILLPTEIYLVAKIKKIKAEGLEGFFCLLPRHRDFVAALASGILTYMDENGRESHVAVMEGTLVKKGDEVLVSTRKAVKDENLELLHKTVKDDFARLQEKETKMRSASARIEAGFIRRFLEFQDHGR
jgi:F-type H+-transporting ATPase subunit epsilon